MPRSRDLRREKQQEYLRSIGLAGYTPAGPVRERLRFLHDRRGITFDVLAERTGLDRETILSQHRGVNKRGKPIRSAQIGTARAVLGARFTPEDVAWAPALGVRRRLQALAAEGFTLPFLAARLPVTDYQNLHNTTSGKRSRGTVRAEMFDAVATLYDKLAGSDPVAAGVLAQAASRCRSFASRNGYAPSGCWDPDTIDDPEAIPQWTGRCGTWWGWHIHGRDGIPMCDRCAPFADSEPYPGFDGARLRALRERRGYSRPRLADRVGIHSTTLQYWETGRSKPVRQNKLDTVLSVLDADPEDVCTEE